MRDQAAPTWIPALRRHAPADPLRALPGKAAGLSVPAELGTLA